MIYDFIFIKLLKEYPFKFISWYKDYIAEFDGHIANKRNKNGANFFSFNDLAYSYYKIYTFNTCITKKLLIIE